MAILALLPISCKHGYGIDDVLPTKDHVDLMDYDEAQQQFAQILSSAVASNTELREYIKQQALQQFDNDYDVFYPFVKNEKVSGDETFRDLLLKHCTQEQLLSIEATLPKLNILVPDFSWVDESCFSVNNWDTESELVTVGYDDRRDNHPIYYSGELVAELDAASFPSFPVLIVKENERMSASMATKSGEFQYSFVSPVFDGSRREAKTRGGLWGSKDETLENNESPNGELWSAGYNLVPYNELSLISPRSIAAYNEFGTGWNNACQRDYIYYDMSRTNSDNGVLRIHERELLYRFSLTPSALLAVADAEGEDPTGLNDKMELRNKDLPGCAEAVRRMWANGRYDIRIDYYQLTSDGNLGITGTFVFDIAPEDLIYAEKCYRNYHWNVLGQSWNTYTIDASCIKPKLYYPSSKSNSLFVVTRWNLAAASNNMVLRISEFDKENTKTETTTASFKLSTNFSFNSEIGAGIDGIKLSYGLKSAINPEITITKTLTVVSKEEPDNLGEIILDYADNVVLKAENGGYVIKEYDNGRFRCSVLPIDMSNEYTILNTIKTNH